MNHLVSGSIGTTSRSTLQLGVFQISFLGIWVSLLLGSARRAFDRAGIEGTLERLVSRNR